MSDYEMSLLYVIRNGFELNQDYYKCPDNETLWKKSVKRPYSGSYFVGSTAVIITFYILCLIAIASSDRMKTSAYKMMIMLGIMDIVCLLGAMGAEGVLAILGATLCTFPFWTFATGSITLGSWLGSCASSIALAATRVCDLNPQLKLKKVIEGRGIYIIMFLISLYAFYGTFLTNPCFFSPEHGYWLFDPLLGKDPNLYVSYIHSGNNLFMTGSTSLIYGYLAFLVWKQSVLANSTNSSSTKKRILLQCFFLCFFHITTSLLYIYMQYFYSPLILNFIATISLQISNSSACFVYIVLNQTIRKSVVALFLPKSILKNNTSVGIQMTSQQRSSHIE